MFELTLHFYSHDHLSITSFTICRDKTDIIPKKQPLTNSFSQKILNLSKFLANVAISIEKTLNHKRIKVFYRILYCKLLVNTVIV